DTGPVTFVKTGAQTFEVVAIFTDKVQLTNYVISTRAFELNVAGQFDARVFVAKAPDVSVTKAKHAVDRAAAAFPTARVQDQSGYKKDQAAQVNQFLNFVYVLL